MTKSASSMIACGFRFWTAVRFGQAHDTSITTVCEPTRFAQTASGSQCATSSAGTPTTTERFASAEDRPEGDRQMRPCQGEGRLGPRCRGTAERSSKRVGSGICEVALVHNLTLVTHNTADYQNVPGSSLDDWLIP